MHSHLSIKTPAPASSFSTPKSRDVQQKFHSYKDGDQGGSERAGIDQTGEKMREAEQ